MLPVGAGALVHFAAHFAVLRQSGNAAASAGIADGGAGWLQNGGSDAITAHERRAFLVGTLGQCGHGKGDKQERDFSRHGKYHIGTGDRHMRIFDGICVAAVAGIAWMTLAADARGQSATSFNITNATVRFLVLAALRVQKDQIVGGPGWLDTGRFDIEAKTGRPEKITQDQIPPLLESLLRNDSIFSFIERRAILQSIFSIPTRTAPSRNRAPTDIKMNRGPRKSQLTGHRRRHEIPGWQFEPFALPHCGGSNPTAGQLRSDAGMVVRPGR